MKSIVFDAGALIAYERDDRRVVAMFVGAQAHPHARAIVIPAGVVGQVWRSGRIQAKLARLLKASSVRIEPLTDERARAAGQLCGVTKTSDVIDASVVLCARALGCPVVTSDVDDLRRLNPHILCVEL